jgi:nuclear cap-binding protein subunit 1
MHRLIEMEIRLAYHDRIMESLPPAMQLIEDMHAPALQPTDPLFPYENKGESVCLIRFLDRLQLPRHADHEHYTIAAELMGMMSRKETAEAVVQKVRDLAGLTTPDQPIPSAHRYVAMMCILNLGARSFSHFLNAIERYQQLIFALGRDKSEKRDLLMAVHDFWRYNGQMKVIVIDKYLQYGVVEASDVVSLLFGELSKPAINEESGHPVPTVWTNYYAWEVLRMVIDKSQGRIASIERRVADLEAMELQARTRRDALRAAEVDAAGAAGDSAEVPSAVSEPGKPRFVDHAAG